MSEQPPASDATLLRRIWNGWLAISRTIGRFNTLLILSLIYFLVVPLFSLWRLADPLRVSTRGAGRSGWRDVPADEESVERYSRLY